MAGVDIAASIVGLALAGIKLTQALHEFGCSYIQAQEQIEDVIFEITTYASTLKALAEKLESDKHVHSDQGLCLMFTLLERSDWLFAQIRALLPQSADKMSKIARMKWHFKKGRCQWLCAKLSSLKLSLLVVIQTLYAGRVIIDANERGDETTATKERITLEKTHLCTLLVRSSRQRRTAEQLEENAAGEEKDMIDASPSGHPEGYIPVRCLALIQYEEDTKIIDTPPMDKKCSEDKDGDQANALIVQDSLTWSNLVIQCLTVVSQHNAESDSDQDIGRNHTKGLSSHPRKSLVGHSSQAQARSGRHSGKGVDGSDSTDRKSNVQHDHRDPIPDAEDGYSRRNQYQNPRVHGESENELEDHADDSRAKVRSQLQGSVRIRQSGNELTYKVQERPHNSTTQASLSNQSSTNQPMPKKFGIRWRRGAGTIKGKGYPSQPSRRPPIWRDFMDEKLRDFNVSNQRFNITRESFPKVDKWTEIEIERKTYTISSDALEYLGYTSYEYERFVQTVQPTDSEGTATGPAYDTFVTVLHIDIPITFLELLQLVSTTRTINRARQRREDWYRVPLKGSPVSRSELNLEDDLPYPHTPLGRSGFMSAKMINKGSRWLNLGNYVMSAISNGDMNPNSIAELLRVAQRGGKDIPLVRDLGGQALVDWKDVGASGDRKSGQVQVEELADEDRDEYDAGAGDRTAYRSNRIVGRRSTIDGSIRSDT